MASTLVARTRLNPRLSLRRKRGQLHVLLEEPSPATLQQQKQGFCGQFAVYIQRKIRDSWWVRSKEFVDRM
jgi:hypothetical protein